MFETGKSLSAISKFNSVIEKNQPIYKLLLVVEPPCGVPDGLVILGVR